MENKNIISISGKIGSGKDECVKIIQYLTSGAEEKYSYQKYKEIYNTLGDFGIGYLPEWENKKFADKLKDMECLLLGCTREMLEDREFKESQLGEEWWYYKDDSGKLFNTFDYDYIPNASKYALTLIKPTPRLFLQLIGTECFRQIIHPNSWVNATFSNYDQEDDKWIFSDCRFPNELKAIKDRNGITIRVTRPLKFQNETTQHESEIALDNSSFDYEILNNGTIDDLVEKIRLILNKENIN